MLQPSALTTPRPDVGRALATLAKRCSRALGSGRRPRRHVGTNTTPRFCVHHGPRRHLRWPDVLACARERKVAGHGGSVERTQGAGVRSASAAPPWASGVRPGSSARCGCLLPQVVPSRPDHPSAPHVQDISRAATQAKRATADAEAPRCVWAHTAPRPPIRAELRGASFGVHRLLAALLQPALCQAEHMGPKLLEPRPQQGSVRPARAPLSTRAAVTITTTSAKGAGDDKSRRSHSPPTCARGTAPPTGELQAPQQPTPGGTRRLRSSDSSSAAVFELTTTAGYFEGG